MLHHTIQLQTGSSSAGTDHLKHPSYIVIHFNGSNYYQVSYSTSEPSSWKTSTPQQQNYTRVRLSVYLENFSWTKIFQQTHKYSWINFSKTCQSCAQHQRLLISNRACWSWRISTRAPTFSWEQMRWSRHFSHRTLDRTKSSNTEIFLICFQSWGERIHKPNRMAETGLHCQRGLVARAAV
jgi:hypothetical protein